jgi:putative FmdB family regulatory protein
MPNYEYRCLKCNRNFEVYILYSEYGKHKTGCPYCESTKVQRRIGRLRFARSEESRLESLADPSNLEGLEDDPKSLARMMRQMSNEMGEDLGSEFDEVVDRLESGQSPEEVESALPDLGADMGADMGGGFGMG